jgi:hypothetical protein
LGVPTGAEITVAWLWTDTLADLLETIDRVAPESLCGLRARPVAYRMAEDGDPVALAREVLTAYTTGRPTAPLRTSDGGDPERSRSSRPS